MPNKIINDSYSPADPEIKTRRPLLFGCSGGGGHNTAIMGVHDNLPTIFAKQRHAQESKEDVLFEFMEHTPVLYAEKPLSMTGTLIRTGVELSSFAFVKQFVDKQLTIPLTVPTEIRELSHKQTVGANLVRLNIDMRKKSPRERVDEFRILGLLDPKQKPSFVLCLDTIYYVDPIHSNIYVAGKGTGDIPAIIRNIFPKTYYPDDPTGKREASAEEVYEIQKFKSCPPLPVKKRFYKDMLLDAYDSGYQGAALWNALQKGDFIKDLEKLVSLQPGNDKKNYETVKKYALNALLEAGKAGKPYTEIISTQAMALPALCDALIEYNEITKSNIVIHQYMTDLPTEGAVHFFKPLSTLTPQQQKVMKLYGVGMHKEIMKKFFPNGYAFSGVHNIDAKNNPMVRPGFADPQYDNSNNFDKDIVIELAGEQIEHVKAHEKIASIMLGSQASEDSFEYIEPLLKQGMDKVFVFGGNKGAIREKIQKLIEVNPGYAKKIIPLGNQDDTHIAPLMSRSDIVVIRGGGLTVMEQLAMNHNENQIVLFHHKNTASQYAKLSSGVSWEDDNVDTLIGELRAKNIRAEKTSPNRAERQLADILKPQQISMLVTKLHPQLEEALKIEKNLFMQYLEDPELRARCVMCIEKNSENLENIRQAFQTKLKDTAANDLQSHSGKEMPSLKVADQSVFLKEKENVAPLNVHITQRH